MAWGSAFLLTAEALEGINPTAVTWLRIVLGLAVLTSLPKARRVRVARSDWPRIALVGMGWMALPMLLFSVSQQWLSSSVTGMLNGSLPLISAVIAAVLLRRMPGRRQALGLLVGLIGVIAISIPSLGGGSNAALGTGLVLLSMITYGLAVNVMVPLHHAYGSIPVISRALAVAAVATTPLGVVGLASSSFPFVPVVSVVALGVIATGIAFVPAGILMGRVGATRGSVSAYLTPVVALVLGVAVRSEAVDLIQVAGLAAALAGAWLTTRATG